jgi:Chitobiase/beta-hexosaminidase C-terminal domain
LLLKQLRFTCISHKKTNLLSWVSILHLFMNKLLHSAFAIVAATSLLAAANLPADNTGEVASPASPNREVPKSPALIEQTAKDLFALTWVADCDPRILVGDGRVGKLKKVRDALDAKDWAGALEAFKVSTLEKLRLSDGPNGFGMTSGRLDPWSVGEPRWKWRHQTLVSDSNRVEILRRADDLLNGFVIGGVNVDGAVNKDARVSIGKPSAIDWKAASASASGQGDEDWPWRISAFDPLLGAYILTADRKYLDAWAAYADDWAMNQREGLPGVGIDMGDRWGNSWEIVTLFRYFRGISVIPGGIELIPADTYARVMTRLVHDALPLTLFYHQANMTNWTDVAVPQLIDIAFLLDEYKCAPQILREALRDLELLTPLRHNPDGVDVDNTFGYWNQYLLGAMGARERIADRLLIPEYLAPPWDREWRKSFDKMRWLGQLNDEIQIRARFAFANVTPDGEVPIGAGRVGHRKQDIDDRVTAYASELATFPSLQPLLAFQQKQIPPAFTSECFPVSGYFYQRAGWKPGDSYLFMQCPTVPATGSIGRRSANAIGIGAYGADLIETGENGPYDPPRSPLLVDGQEGWITAAFLYWAHRGLMGGGDNGPGPAKEPPPWRWHASDRFDFAEGYYTAGYGKQPRINGVEHRRQVFFVRQAGLWVVVDRVRSSVPHDYRLDWRFPIAPGKDKVFSPEQINADAGAQTITTHRPDGPNIDLQQFSATPLIYDRGEERSNPSDHYRTHDCLRVGSSWKTDGTGVVVTAIMPLPKDGTGLSDVHSLTKDGVTGFSAVAPNGCRITFLNSDNATASLTAGPMAADAGTLLVVEKAGQPISGIFLDAKAVSLDGKPQDEKTADAEFLAASGNFSLSPIQTPVSGVQIEPASREGFVGSQPISLSCTTPGVDIRYTTDGSDPTLLSTLYAEPFSISSDTVVKARAFRQGTQVMPMTMSGREASLVSRADFTALASLPAVTAATIPGLRFELRTGRWQDLFIAPQTVPVSATGRVDDLFQSSEQKPHSIYSIRYSGYLKAPAEGVYTFHAPPESYQMNIVAGYELQVFVDGQQWYPATTRHALGSWSIALKQGNHHFEVFFADLRGDAPERTNPVGYAPWIWTGQTPVLQLEGPGLPLGPIPKSLLSCEPAAPTTAMAP